jgi:uncharacterized protein (DUF1800 family)
MKARKATPIQRQRIERLFWRAGFGALPGEVERLALRGTDAAVAELLRPRGPQLRKAPAPTVEGQPIDPLNSYGHDVLWWLDRMVRARHPLVERMTLNWHDHFGVSNEKVGDQKLMQIHYFRLRSNALGNFRKLCQQMLIDGAMQQFLDIANSDKDSPNENFARELFELYTLGVNNGYTEKDIREAARAFTGYTYDYDKKAFGYDAERHDDGVKRIFGKSGRFSARDVVNMALNHPKHAPFLVKKIWDYFIPRPAPKKTVTQMVQAYKKSGLLIRPVLDIILKHPFMYANLNDPDQVKPPVVYVAGMLRKTNISIDRQDWVWMLENMGQQPGYPPNVSGWEQDEAWLSTASIRARYEAASRILDIMDIKDGSIKKAETPAQALSNALRATGRPWMSPKGRAALTRYARTSVAGRDEDYEVEHYWPERQRMLRHALLAGPDAQVC